MYAVNPWHQKKYALLMEKLLVVPMICISKIYTQPHVCIALQGIFAIKKAAYQWNAVTNHIVPLTLRSKESAQKQISALMLLRYIHVQRGIIAVRV